MRRAALPLLAFLLAALMPMAGIGETVPMPHVVARLIPESAAAAPGATLNVDLHLEIEPGWHTYWRYPGDAGLATQIAWKLPAGVTAGETAWPVPRHFIQSGIGSYGYENQADLVTPLAIPAAAAPGAPLKIAAHVEWLVCKAVCIPGEADVTLDQPVAAGPAAPDPRVAPLFRTVDAEVPKPLAGANFAIDGSGLALRLPAGAAPAGSSAFFAPFAAGPVDDAGDQTSRIEAGGLTIAVPLRPGAAKPSTLHGIVVVTDPDGTPRAGFVIEAAPGPAISGGSSLRAANAPGNGLEAVLLALLGGMILNLMPCVFPILSIKILSLAAHAHAPLGWRMANAAGYAGGVIGSFAALGGVLIAIRSAGAVAGWGFQLQSPVMVALLAYIFLGCALSLSGVFDLALPLGPFSRLGHRGSGFLGSAATGVLATLAATPCTAPFMGTALGYALVAPVVASLAVFVALGVGLALPYLVIALLPALARLMPRPGRWMESFKQILAFPLYASAAWMIWVLTQQIGPEGMLAALAGLVLVGFAAWLYGRLALTEGNLRLAGLAGVLACLAGATELAAAASTAPPAADKAAGRAAPGQIAYERFSNARLATLEAEHRPVFVNLTASWCVTCQVNDRLVLGRAEIARAFASRKIVALKGDWTNQDPDITQFLQSFGRSGVPFYVLFDSSGRATILPQLLTFTTVSEAIGR